MASRFISLLSISSLAVLLASLSATPVVAVSVDFTPYHARSLHGRDHDALALRKRSPNLIKRCRPKPEPAPQPSAAPPPPPPPHAVALAPPQAHAPPSPSLPGNLAKLGPAKAMLAWPNGDDGLKLWTDTFKGVVDLIYTWNPECPPSAASLNIVCCPMNWGFGYEGRFDAAAKGAKCVMAENEPEIPSQSNMSPEAAAARWNKHVKPLKAQGTILISPSVTSDEVNALAWMSKFVESLGGLDASGIDVFSVHFYDTSFEKFKDWVTKFHNKFPKPIIVTEIACQNFNGDKQCTRDEIFAFYSQVADFVKSNDFILKIAPFGTMRDMTNVNPLNRMMNVDNGTPNDLAYSFFNKFK